MKFQFRRLILLAWTLCYALPVTASDQTQGGSILPDLQADVSDSSLGYTMVNGEWSWSVRVTNGTGGSAVFEDGAGILVVDLPANLSFGRVSVGTQSVTGTVDCSLVIRTVNCVADGAVFFTGNGSQITVTVFDVVPLVSGTYSVPAAGGICVADPDNVVDESDDLNNSCVSDEIAVRDVPEFTPVSWLGVTMWDNVARVYDMAEKKQVNAVPFALAGGEDIHAINEIVRDPLTGQYYVFHRFYETTSHSFGTFDPVNGITTITDTGVEFHSAAFDEDGTLYAAGKNRTLYTINPADGVLTALCSIETEAESSHGALVWDAGQDELLLIINSGIFVIDLDSLPPDAVTDCDIQSTDVQISVSSVIFTAFYTQGNIFIVDDSYDLWLLARDGAASKLDTLPMGFHGMVLDPGTLPSKADSCIADGFALISQGGSATELWALNPENGSLSFISTLGFRISGIDFDPVTQRLMVIRDERFVSSDILNQYDPCTGQLLTSTIFTGDVFSVLRHMDVTTDGDLYTWSGSGLVKADPATATTTSLGGNAFPVDSLGIIADEVFVWDNSFESQLDVYGLSDWPAFKRTVPLIWGVGLEPATYENEPFREIYSLDPIRGTANHLALIGRVDAWSSSRYDGYLPNALATIEADGNVTKIAHLPASTHWVIVRVEESFKDSFEPGEN